jgi:hypothetical protein
MKLLPPCGNTDPHEGPHEFRVDEDFVGRCPGLISLRAQIINALRHVLDGDDWVLGDLADAVLAVLNKS